MAGNDPGVLGLIAGRGRFPLAVARSARRGGRAVSAVAFRDQTDPDIEREVSEVTWIWPGEVGRGVDALRSAGVREAVMAGKVPKAPLIADAGPLRLDACARALVRALRDRRDDSILGLVAEYLEQRGIRLLPQAQLVPDLLAGPGPLGRTRLGPDQRRDAAFGWPVAKALAGLDVGQTAVVKQGAVLALEAIEGTDAAIRRAGDFAAGACAVKVAKPRQDPRFDLPAIGRGTVAALVAARAAALVFEAGATLILDRDEMTRAADAHHIALVGWDAPPGEANEAVGAPV